MSEERPFGYVPYKLPNGTKVFLTARPDSYSEADVRYFIEQQDPFVRFQLTDDPMRREIPVPYRVHWYPWRPLHKLPVEMVYAAINLIHNYVGEKQTIWMHCDSSSMRAPTFFGLYLRAYFENHMHSIVEAAPRWVAGKFNSEASCPISYSLTSMRMDPEVRQMIRAWQCLGERGAYSFLHRDPHRQNSKLSESWYREKWTMDFAAFMDFFKTQMPEDWKYAERAADYVSQVEYNSAHIPLEIYKPKQEIKTFLLDLVRLEQDNPTAWLDQVLDRLDDA